VTTAQTAEIGVFGGSGFYQFLDDVTEVEVDTPYGPAASPVHVGSVDDRRVAFLPRHGADHQFPPHRINYRANLWAMRALGVRQILGPCAVGSLNRELGPGTIVIPDQLVDRTSGRTQTYYDAGGVHVSFADPYCAHGGAAALKAAATATAGERAHAGGAMVVIEGPRFSTRAESQWYAAAGWTLVNMTGHPEAVLARELGLCYTSLALVTDLDAGIDASESVTHTEVLAVFARNIERLRALVLETVRLLPAENTDCACAHALDGMELPIELP
jgi:5'-methylthioadenosine phosphorylase